MLARLALALAGSAAVAAPAHAAEAVLATLPAESPISAHAGRVVFSEQRADGRWHLRQWSTGTVRDVAVAPQRRPFDVDLGPDASGRTVAVYSRCATDPPQRVLFSPLPDLSRSTGCAVHRVALDGGREQRLRGHGSEVLPSTWRGALAFTRHVPLERAAHVIVRTASGRSHRIAGLTTAPCPAGWCTQAAPRATAEELDVGARRLAIVWRYEGGAVTGVGPAWEASSVALRPGSRPVVGGAGHVSGACGGGSATGVTATATGFSLLQTRSDCENATKTLARMDGARRHEAVTTDDVRAATWDGATPYVLRAIGGSSAMQLVRLDPPRTRIARRRSYGAVVENARPLRSRTYRVGAGGGLRGAARIRVPRAWQHRNRDGSRTQHFAAQQKDCRTTTQVALRADATRESPQRRIARSTRGAIALAASGRALALVELEGRTGVRRLYGIASRRIAPRRVVDVRTFTELRGRCTDGIVLADAIPQALARLLRTADLRGLRVARR